MRIKEELKEQAGMGLLVHDLKSSAFRIFSEASYFTLSLDILLLYLNASA